jgi:Ca2+/Na+ antiporter
MIAMMASMVLVIALALLRGKLDRVTGVLLLAAYPLTIWLAFLKRS